MLNFIINPRAGGGRSGKIWEKLEACLVKRSIHYKAYFTQKNGDAIELAARISQEYDKEEYTLVAVGGDGTFNEVLEGVWMSERLTMGYIPTGTGNDLARGLRLPKSPRGCLNRILRPKKIRLVDYGLSEYGAGEHRRFAVSCGFGLDAQIGVSLFDIKKDGWLSKGIFKKLSYLFFGIKHLLLYKGCRGYAVIDDIKKIEFNYICFVSSHIHPYKGGGFRFAPKADSGDGELSVCILHQRSKLKLLRILLASIFGNHLKYPGVRSFDCRHIRIVLEQEQPIHADGERCGVWRELVVRCIPGKIKMIT